MRNFDFFLPTRFFFGSAKLSKIGELVKSLGRKVALVSDKQLVDLGVTHRVRAYLEEKKIDAVEFTEVTPNPLSTVIDNVAKTMKGERIDVVIGVGGGSSLDFAKGLAVALSHEEQIWSYVNVRGKSLLRPSAKTLPVVAVATTSGTGSEVTPFAILTNPHTSEKCAIVGEHIFPRIAIVDPELTLTLPSRLTASTGIDALCHAIESYLDVCAHGVTEIAALEAMRLISTSLPTAVLEKNNLEARTKMAWAATLGGIAISNGNVTLIHAMGHPISGRFDIGHGEAMAMVLPGVMKHSWELNLDKFARIAEAMDVVRGRLSLREMAKRSVTAVERLLGEIGLKLRLSDYGVMESDLNDLAEDTTGYMVGCLEAHPRTFSLDEVREIYREIF
ncbi:MAG: iron-containing alcohol dehydrogenase [Proteobacteria bacterium]|nr:iron-containing alcohol dehydrogenase [Pseudomonadota bacterium]